MFNKMKYIFVSGRRFITFASIMNNHPKSPIIDLQQQQLLLRMEYEHEKEEFKRQTETMGVARKVKRGLCWYPASPGRSYYNSLNQLVIDITPKIKKSSIPSNSVVPSAFSGSHLTEK